MSLKARIGAARPRTAEHRLRIEDDRAARVELAAAQASEDEGRIEVAQAALDACYETLHLTAMPLPEWDDLLTHHPAPEALRLLGRWCDPARFLPPALAKCVSGADASEEDWRDYVSGGAINPGEALALLEDLALLHDRSPDPSTGKDTTTTSN